MRVLVTGGAGYIGSVTARVLSKTEEVLIVDDLSMGHRAAALDTALETVDVEDAEGIAGVCRRFRPEACIHFAARSLVSESVARPLQYFGTNVCGTLNLAKALADAGCRRIVFSSTAAVYGSPDRFPITEAEEPRPINPYGLSKSMVERALAELDRAGQVRYVSLRYFNAAGADVEGGLGEDHDPETHLIPNLIAAAMGRTPRATIFGVDYPTPDGTCVRDYVHVLDLARAHVLALGHLRGGGESGVFNLGNGSGFSVRRVVEAVRNASGADFEVTEGPRRRGDPPVLVASSEKIKSALGWEPRLSSLDEIVRTAWAWHQARPDGYPD